MTGCGDADDAVAAGCVGETDTGGADADGTAVVAVAGCAVASAVPQLPQKAPSALVGW